MASKTKTIMIKNNLQKVIKIVIRHNFKRIENEKIISIDKPNLSQMFFHTWNVIVYKSIPGFATHNRKAQLWVFFFIFHFLFRNVTWLVDCASAIIASWPKQEFPKRLPPLHSGCTPPQQPALPGPFWTYGYPQPHLREVATFPTCRVSPKWMKIDNETQGQKEPADVLPLTCPQRRGQDWAGRSLWTQGQTGHRGLGKEGFGISVFGHAQIHWESRF